MHVDGFTANNAHLREQFDMVPQGISADLIATLEGFSREECDALAVESQRRAALAISEGRFERSLIPIFHDDGTLALAVDEHPRAGTTLADLAKLSPSFEQMGAYKKDPNGLSIDETALKAYPQLSAINHVHHGGNSVGGITRVCKSTWTEATRAHHHDGSCRNGTSHYVDCTRTRSPTRCSESGNDVQRHRFV
jgi:acetyl-CoA C-acetyltransferase